MTLIVPAEKLAGLLDIDAAIDAVAEAYRANAGSPGLGSTHTRVHHEGRRLTVHPGGSLPDRMAGLFAHFERLDFGTAAQGYTGVGRRLYAAYDTDSAALATVILGSLPLFPFEGPDAFGTETAITSAVGTRALARPDSRIMALIGTGRQARRHLHAMARLFPLETVRVHSRDPDNVALFCAEMSEYVAVTLEPTRDPDTAVDGADLVVCATASNVPVLDGTRLAPGAHVTSIVNGNRIAVRPGEPPRFRRELDDETVVRADVICAVMPEQAIKDEQGDLAEPVLKGLIDWDDVRDLGKILDGSDEGRTGADQITLFKQNSDQGVGFMALARLALDAARQHAIGIEI